MSDTPGLGIEAEGTKQQPPPQTAGFEDEKLDDLDPLPETKDGENKQTDEKKSGEGLAMVPFMALFRFATPFERVLMFIATLAAGGNGLALPLFAVVFGDLINTYGLTQDEILDKAIQNTNYFLIIGACSFVCSWAGLGLWMYTAETRTKRLREEYLRSILRQDMSYFDLRKPGEIPSQLTSDSTEYQNGTGEKISNGTQHTVTFFAGIIVGFIRGWQLALLVLGVTPFMGVTITIFTVAMGKWSKKGQDAYTTAGAIADEAISAVRTVNAFNAQDQEAKRYCEHLDVARVNGIKSTVANGSAMGLINLVVFSAYGLCLWFGTYLVRERITNAKTGESYNPGDVIGVFFAIIMGAMSIGQVGPAFQSIALARAAALRMYNVIDTKPKIDSASTEGEKPESIRGDITVENLSFAYPSRKDSPVFSDFNLHIRAGQTVAFVGASGSGKSSLVALLQRFYDPDSGVIRVDGRELNKLNIGWWRDHVGVVSQEPVLFSGTIKENIAYGREGVSDEQIVNAAKAANAHNFVMDMKEGYSSQVGEDGSLLSGGQKQRIAIARAILKNPKILLLDEATSALDNESERLVQQALNNLMVDRTTLIIAHRLSTIINSDVIFVLENGKIIEMGKHEELMAKDGVYANLLRAQQTSQEEKSQMAVATEKSDKIVAIQVAEAKKERLRTKSHAGVPEAEIPAKKPPPASNSRVFNIVSDMYILIALGTVAAAASGVAFPVWSLIFGDMMANLFVPDAETQDEKSRLYAIYFFLLGLGLFFSEIAKATCFGFVGERLTLRLREMSFRHIFRQEIGFFDEPDNNPRALSTRLSLDAAKVQGGTTSRIGLVIQNLATIVTGLLIAFIKSWSLALVVLSLAPVMVIASVVQMKFVLGFQSEGKGAFEKAGQIASEAVANIRTIASFRAEKFVYSRFSVQLQESVKVGFKISNTSGIALGFSQLTIFFAYALYFWYGAKLVANGDITFGDMMKVIFAIVIAAMGVGQTSQMAADVGKGIEGRDNIFALLDRKSKIDSSSTEGEKAILPHGSLSFDSVSYRYINRPEIPVLRNLNLKVQPGQTLALVGPSGSGKSTIVSLILRFYDPESGKICIDGNDTAKMNVRHLRSQIGVVSQEPRLIDGTIEQNIKYGKASATIEEVIEAAKQANIHETIMRFPQKYDTQVGVRGSKLSGGQKQRVAIARALLRNPKILVLDEATSALDAKSERIVQQAIEKLMASRERTTVIIAHRLSTVKNADIIAVLDKGVVVEQGNHKQLMELNGVYTALYRAGEKRQ